MKVLVTCPPMLSRIEEFEHIFKEKGISIDCPEVKQTLSVKELKNLLPNYDGWIIGDDPANQEVLEAGKKGRLKAAVKWGVGVDNVDFSAAKTLSIPIENTPGVFGEEVADIATGYVIGLARQTFAIDRAVRRGDWVKPSGISLSGKTVALVGFGDIGRNTAKRLQAAGMNIIVYDPYLQIQSGIEVETALWPQRIIEADFIVLTCSLNKSNQHMIDHSILSATKVGVRIINVARGGLIEEEALIEALTSGQVHSVALDVFENEPLPDNSPLRQYQQCILGSHNASNTVDAVRRATHQSIEKLFKLLGVA